MNELVMVVPLVALIFVGAYMIIHVSDNINSLSINALNTPHQFIINITDNNKDVHVIMYGFKDTLTVMGIKDGKIIIVKNKVNTKMTTGEK